jgi:hypothetical protein
MESKPGHNLFEFLMLTESRIFQYIGSEEITALKAYIHGYLQGLFQNNIAETSFPKYRWFSAWVKGRINSEFTLDYGWDKHIQSAAEGEKKTALKLFYQLYKEFNASEVICHYQQLGKEKKIFEDAPHGLFWKRMSESTSGLLLFELPPSSTAWCLLLNEDKRIMHTMEGESKLALIEKINNQYFATIDTDWTLFDEKFYLKNLVINRPENNY